MSKSRMSLGVCLVVMATALSFAVSASARTFVSNYPSRSVSSITPPAPGGIDGIRRVLHSGRQLPEGHELGQGGRGSAGRDLDTHIGSLLGVGARSTGTWQGHSFKYRGARGRRAARVGHTALSVRATTSSASACRCIICLLRFR